IPYLSRRRPLRKIVLNEVKVVSMLLEKLDERAGYHLALLIDLIGGLSSEQLWYDKRTRIFSRRGRRVLATVYQVPFKVNDCSSEIWPKTASVRSRRLSELSQCRDFILRHRCVERRHRPTVFQ